MSRSQPPTPSEYPVIEPGDVLDLVSREELEQRVYSKKALDETFRDIRDTLQKQQDQIDDLFVKAKDGKIEIIHESPWQKLRNALRL